MHSFAGNDVFIGKFVISSTSNCFFESFELLLRDFHSVDGITFYDVIQSYNCRVVEIESELG